MPCPSSPEPDGFHRFVLPASGTERWAHCRYCGATPRTGPPSEPNARWTASRAKGNAASNAARRRKREATP